MTKASPLSNVPFSLISQEFRSRETRINELTSRKQTIETELSSIRSELAQLQNPTVETSNPNPGLAVAVPGLVKPSKRSRRPVGRPAKNQTLRETVYSVLGKKKQKSVQINDLADAVLQRGYSTLSDRTTFLKNIRNAMRGDPRFVKLGTGLFGLAENQHPTNPTN